MTRSEAIQIYLDHYDEIGFDLVQAGVKELEQQGHRATGKLINSITKEVKKLLNEINTDISYFSYGNIVNTGVSPAKVPFTSGSGKKTSKFITALAQWVKLKKITGGLDKDIMSATFAIARKMKKEGIPTSGSFRFSRNGRRTGWIDRVEERYSVSIQDRMELATEEFYGNALDAVLEDLVKRFSSIEILN